MRVVVANVVVECDVFYGVLSQFTQLVNGSSVVRYVVVGGVVYCESVYVWMYIPCRCWLWCCW